MFFRARKIHPNTRIACLVNWATCNVNGFILAFDLSGFTWTGRVWKASQRSCLLIQAPLPASSRVTITSSRQDIWRCMLLMTSSGIPSLKLSPGGLLWSFINLRDPPWGLALPKSPIYFNVLGGYGRSSRRNGPAMCPACMKFARVSSAYNVSGFRIKLQWLLSSQNN